MTADAEQRANLSGLVDRFLRIRLDFVAGVVGDFRNGLLEDGRRLSHWERRVQVGFALENTRMRSIRRGNATVQRDQDKSVQSLVQSHGHQLHTV